MAHIRDRIKELRRVRAGDLRPCPWNWREHPQEQREALEATLAEVGYAGAGLARELEDGSLELIDGHMRAERDLEAENRLVELLDLQTIRRRGRIGAARGLEASRLIELLEGAATKQDSQQAASKQKAVSGGNAANRRTKPKAGG